MEIKVFNTLSRKKEVFTPIKEGNVGIYSCGPTVYNVAHIGNMRAYIFMDSLDRMFRYNGYKVKQVMNITDVGHLLSDGDTGEDKMVKSAREQHKLPLEIAATITARFLADLDALNIVRPTVMPRATDNIKEMIQIVQILLDKGYAYETEDGIYYDVEKFADYGKLSGINLEEQKAGARVELNEFKRNPIDFALWKKAQPNHIMQWDSPWGKGFPGWHIECTAMSRKYLGEVFDIHTGGIDHIPIHHENEIAQSEGAFGKKTTNYWLHNEFMLYEGGKMSKSLGNCYSVTDLIDKGYSPMEFRYLCLNVQYRQKINFSFDALNAAKTAYERLTNLVLAHKDGVATTAPEKLEEYEQQFHSAINDDLNVPLAIGIMWTMLKEEKSKDIYELALKMDEVTGLRLAQAQRKTEEKIDLPDDVQQLVEERAKARADKDWALSDSLRDQINAKGYQIKDGKEGQTITKK